ncbi:MAG: 30S ribosomal protein S9 [Chloroflexota bacterium]
MNRGYYYGTGRRKSSVARVRLIPGAGQIVVNGKEIALAFPTPGLQQTILEPLQITDTAGKFSATVKVVGGGISGQAGAIRHGLARALVQSDETLRPVLRKAGMLTRDPRVKERKKYGLKRARKAPQYTKR